MVTASFVQQSKRRTQMKNVIKRMIGAARFDADTYEQVEADRASTGSAIFVVVLASVAAAVGTGAASLADVVGVTVAGLLSWAVWISLTLLIGKWVMPERATHTDVGELLRTTGFSASPGILRVFGIIPVIGLPIFLIVTIWMLLTFVIAVRQALDYSSVNRAVSVCLLGWVIHGLLFFGFIRVAI
jgi:hypothetical protein